MQSLYDSNKYLQKPIKLIGGIALKGQIDLILIMVPIEVVFYTEDARLSDRKKMSKNKDFDVFFNQM